jgi:ribulose-5-phosphate 4-epimerase/fuculose-1-phosphate aldolase
MTVRCVQFPRKFANPQEITRLTIAKTASSLSELPADSAKKSSAAIDSPSSWPLAVIDWLAKPWRQCYYPAPHADVVSRLTRCGSRITVGALRLLIDRAAFGHVDWIALTTLLRSCLAGAILMAAATSVSSQTSGGPTRQILIDELVVANHILANEGVLDGYGHVSVRNQANLNHYFLARAGAPALVVSADITEYDLDSKPVTNASATGYIERFIHGEIYKARPDVMAVVHCHCPEVIPFAAASVPLRPLYHMAYFIGEGVPVFDIRQAAGMTDMLIRTPELGRALARTLGDKSAALMRGHGAAIAATSLHAVVGKAYYLNLNARLQVQAAQLNGGKVNFLAPEEAKKATVDYERSWDFWKSKLQGR